MACNRDIFYLFFYFFICNRNTKNYLRSRSALCFSTRVSTVNYHQGQLCVEPQGTHLRITRLYERMSVALGMMKLVILSFPLDIVFVSRTSFYRSQKSGNLFSLFSFHKKPSESSYAIEIEDQRFVIVFPRHTSIVF
jgi:hypothetical protein